MNARNRLQGQQAHAAGEAFEEILDRLFFAPLIQHRVLVRMDKQHPRMIIQGYTKEGLALCRKAGKSGTDWIGLLSDGTYLAIEAKTTAKGELSYSALTDEQEHHLNEAAAHGLSFLAVEYRAGIHRVWCVLPWKQIPWKQKRTAHHLDLEDALRFAVKTWTDLRKILEQR